MKEEWLLRGAVVPVDVETTATLVAEIKRLIDVVGGLILNQGPHYERGFIDGMQKQMQSSVDKAVNRMAQPEQEPLTENGMYRLGYHNGYGFGEAYGKANAPQRTWVGLTDEEIETLIHRFDGDPHTLLDEVNARLKDKNT